MNFVLIFGAIISVITAVPVAIDLRRNHPRGLMILFATEMWERFSFYGMRALLIFYLTQHFLIEQAGATARYGSYTALVYLLPLLGGVVADRWLGTRKAVAFGAILLVLGHLTMGLEGQPATQQLHFGGKAYDIVSEGRLDSRVASIRVDGSTHRIAADASGGLAVIGLPAESSLPAKLSADDYRLTVKRDDRALRVFDIALALIIMGVGFLKPNISSMVGQLYARHDPRRDAGFTLYYYGINLGGFWAALICGLVGQRFGWNYGFGLAGVGMACGWLIFFLGRSVLGGVGEPPRPDALRTKLWGPINREMAIYLSGILGVAVLSFVVPHHRFVGSALVLAILASVAILTYLIVRVCSTGAERRRMLVATMLVVGAVVFFTLLGQAGTTLNLFASTNVDLNLVSRPMNVLGFQVGTPTQLHDSGIVATSGAWIDTTFSVAQTQSINSGFILLLAPLFSIGWAWLARKQRTPSPLVTFGAGLTQIGLSFALLVFAVSFHDASYRIPLLFLTAMYFLQTTGELCLSPVGLSEITKLSIPRAGSFMMAVWFLASSIAQFVSAWIAGFTGTRSIGGQVLDPQAALNASASVFKILATAGIGAGAIFVVLGVIISRRRWLD